MKHWLVEFWSILDSSYITYSWIVYSLYGVTFLLHFNTFHGRGHPGRPGGPGGLSSMKLWAQLLLSSSAAFAATLSSGSSCRSESDPTSPDITRHPTSGPPEKEDHERQTPETKTTKQMLSKKKTKWFKCVCIYYVHTYIHIYIRTYTRHICTYV